MFCLNKNLAGEFLKRLKSGEINPDKLAGMSSQERRDYFSSFLGKENAVKVNELFERKLLLKNQQAGLVRWAKSLSGIKPQAQRDIIARVNKMEEVLNPENEKAFLEDLAAHALGVSVTMEEAGNISAMAKAVSQAKNAIAKGGDRMDYGRKRVMFDNYVNGLKEDATHMDLVEYLKPENYGKAIVRAAGLTKALVASLDNSVIGRQGLKVLATHPEIWAKNAKQTFVDIYDTFGGKEVMDEIRADVLSRPNAINGLYRKEGLAVGVREEDYPTSLPQKIPGLGKAFKASENAFVGFQYRSRADIFDKMVEIAQKSGGEIEGIGQIANSLTGRGKLGALEPSASVFNNLFFSPRFLKSNIDALTGHALDKDLSPEMRKTAAVNTLKIVGAVASILAIAKAFDKDSVELDPRSSDFGKIKVGNSRFDVSGGMASIITLAARLISGESKSSTTGIVSELNSGDFGAQTRMDVIYNFFENKLSPAAAVVKDIMKGEDFSGKKPTIAGELARVSVPISVQNYMELKDDPESAPILLALIIDALGLGVNTYSAKEEWSASSSDELKSFREKVGEDKFKEANDQFNAEFNSWLDDAVEKEKFLELDEDDKKSVVSKKKNEIKAKVLSKYGFKYRAPEKRLPRF